MTSYVTPKKNSAFILYTSLPSQADSTALQTNPTLAAGDVKVSIDGGALTNLTTLPTVTPAAGRLVKISLSAAEMNGDNITVQFVDAAGDQWCETTINIQTSAQQIDDIATQALLVAVAGYLDTEVAAIKAKTDNLPADPADQSQVEAAITAALAAMPAGILDLAAGVETNLTVRQFYRLVAAVLLGKASGMSTTTAVFRDTNDTMDRVVADVDADGNRSLVSRNSS